jgi:hypothetical protein
LDASLGNSEAVRLLARQLRPGRKWESKKTAGLERGSKNRRRRPAGSAADKTFGQGSQVLQLERVTSFSKPENGLCRGLQQRFEPSKRRAARKAKEELGQKVQTV